MNLANSEMRGKVYSNIICVFFHFLHRKTICPLSKLEYASFAVNSKTIELNETIAYNHPVAFCVPNVPPFAIATDSLSAHALANCAGALTSSGEPKSFRL